MIHQKDQELKQAEQVMLVIRPRALRCARFPYPQTAQHCIHTQWKQERDIAEATIEALRAQLLVGQQAQFSLDEQKVENLALKETIDRLRLDLDEIRNTSPSPGSFGSVGGNMLLKDGNAKKALATLDVELSQSLRSGEVATTPKRPLLLQPRSTVKLTCTEIMLRRTNNHHKKKKSE
jgi:hypothetical protein